MLFVYLWPLSAWAAEPPPGVQRILQDSPLTPEQLVKGDATPLFDLLKSWALQPLAQPLRFAGRAVLYLLAATAVSAAAAEEWRGCVDGVAVLGFGCMSLSAMMELTRTVGQTAADCQAYLITFVPVYSGVAALGGQAAGGLLYSGAFFAMSNFLCAAIQRLLLPVMQIYFCLAACAALWGEPGTEQAATLFAKTLSGLLKGCGALFGFVLGLQHILAGNMDSATLKCGQGILQGAIPVVGDAASAALASALAAVRLLKGSLALAALLALGAVFVPVFLQCGLYYLAFSGAGIVVSFGGAGQCGQLCRLFAEGARLCAAVLILYFFMIFLSTALLLLMGNGG